MTSPDDNLEVLDREGLRSFGELGPEAISTVSARFFSVHGSAYERFGPRGRDACREDLAFHLEFLRPVLEFGLAAPMIEYLLWVEGVLSVRAIPSEHVLLSIDWLGEFFAERLEPRQASIVGECMRAVRSGYLLARETVRPAPISPEAWPESVAFEDELLGGNQPGALDVITDCLDRGRNLVDVEMHVVQAALYTIGEKWQANRVTVAQEHLATILAQSIMSHALLLQRKVRLIGKRVLLACVETNHHTVGLHMVADALQLAGWQVQYLGSNVPTGALVTQAADWKPDLIGLSISFPQQLRYAKDAILRLRQLPQAPAVMIGGLAINRFPPLAKLIGAQGSYPDSRSTVAHAMQLVGA
jgi:methanogenic corrinoid protein MtbC1